jgi:hypothetical protein
MRSTALARPALLEAMQERRTTVDGPAASPLATVFAANPWNLKERTRCPFWVDRSC